MSSVKYKYRKETVDSFRKMVKGITTKRLIAQFEREYATLALDKILEQDNFPFIYLSGEVRLMFPAELYQVCKEELHKRGLRAPYNGAN